MPGYSYSEAEYRCGFQNQEIDKELWDGAVSYKYRIEDPRLGRFFSVDPLAPKYPHNSPYAFSENRVVDAIELEGLESVNATRVDIEQKTGVLAVKWDAYLLYIWHRTIHGEVLLTVDKKGNDKEWLKSKWNTSLLSMRSILKHYVYESKVEKTGEEFSRKVDSSYRTDWDKSQVVLSGGLVNEYRHLLGAAVMAAVFGESKARIITDANERENGWINLDDFYDGIADFLNNNYGIKLGVAWLQDIGGDLKNLTLDQVADLMNRAGNFVMEANPQFAIGKNGQTVSPEFTKDDQVVKDMYQLLLGLNRDAENETVYIKENILGN